MLNQVKTAVFVSGGGTNLQEIIDSAARGELPSVEIALVLSSKAGVYALERAKAAGIKTAVVERKAFSQEEFESRVAQILAEENIELIVFAGFMSILSPAFTKKYENRIINVHPSLIPSFCGKGFYGLKVHEAALSYGVKVTGATVHFVNEIPDGGKIIMQKAVEVEEGDTPQILQRRVMERAEWKILPAATEKVAAEILKERLS